MKNAVIFLLFFSAAFAAQAQLDTNALFSPKQKTAFRIGLILPFQAENSLQRLNDFDAATDLYTASKIELDNYATEALDFYQGLRQALEQNDSSLRIDLQVYDDQNNDSITEALLQSPALKKQDLIIGTSSTSSARIVAAFCKKNKIINVQPFTPSKSLTSENPYHLKLAPTIDAHVDGLFLSVLDSFSKGNVIIYSPNNELGKATAARLDSLFKDYNKESPMHFSLTKLTVDDLNSAKGKRQLTDYLKHNERNLLFITSFDGSFVNNCLAQLDGKLGTYSMIAYGMPTWLNSEIIRLDYLNNFRTRVSDAYYADTAREDTRLFIENYTTTYGTSPSEMSFLGFDVMNFLLATLHTYGVDFLEDIVTQRFTGTANKFDIMRERNSKGAIDYYENRHVNVYKVDHFTLEKIY